MKSSEFPKCEMFGDECPYCSEVYRQTGQFTRVVKDETTHLFKPIGKGHKRVYEGQRCENHGNAMVSELNTCPSRWALNGPGKVTKSILTNKEKN